MAVLVIWIALHHLYQLHKILHILQDLLVHSVMDFHCTCSIFLNDNLQDAGKHRQHRWCYEAEKVFEEALTMVYKSILRSESPGCMVNEYTWIMRALWYVRIHCMLKVALKMSGGSGSFNKSFNNRKSWSVNVTSTRACGSYSCLLRRSRPIGL